MARRKPFPSQWTLSGAGHEEVPCAVPGTVAEAMQAADIGDPALGGEARPLPRKNPACRVEEERFGWVGHRPWLLKTTVPLEGFWAERTYIEIRGLCGSGSLHIGEVAVARFERMQGETLYAEITAHIEPVQEELPVSIRFTAAPEQGGLQAALPGIRDGVWLRGVNRLLVTRLCVRANRPQAELIATCRVTPFLPGKYTFSYALACGDTAIGVRSFEEELGAEATVLTHALRLTDASDWVPGSPSPLYSVKLVVLWQNVGCDIAYQQAGMLQVESSKVWANFPACAWGINGKPVHLRGTVWAASAWYPYAPEWMQAQLRALLEARIQCLYVPEPQEERFYDACDQLGMLVWQALPDDPLRAMEVAMRLAHRTCVIQWGLNADPGEAGPAALRAQDDREARIQEVLTALRDDRPFVGMTPGGPSPYPAWKDLAQRQCFNVAGPLWYLGPEMMPRYANDDDALLRITRCTALNAPGTLCGEAGEPLPWPRDGGRWAQTEGAPTFVEQTEAAQWFGRDAADTLEKAALLSRYVQADMLRYLAQRTRWRGAVGFFAGSAGQVSGALCSDAIIERDGAKRPAYHALRNVYAPVQACAALDRTACWIGTPVDAGIQLLVAEDAVDTGRKLMVTASLFGADGTLLVEDIWQAPCRTAEVGRVRTTAPDHPCALLLRLEVYDEGKRIAREDVLLCVGMHALQEALVSSPRTALSLADGVLTNTGDVLALGVCCDGYLDPSLPGWGALLPGEGLAVRPGAAIEGLNITLLLAEPTAVPGTEAKVEIETEAGIEAEAGIETEAEIEAEAKIKAETEHSFFPCEDV